jgi:hypothetical protein
VTAGSAAARAARVLGVVSVLSGVFVFVRGDFQFVRVRGAGVAVAIVVGVLAIGAAVVALRWLVAATGALFVLAAVVQVAGQAAGGNWLGGDGSTASLWLGLGAGLLALAAFDGGATTRQPEGAT